MDKIAPYKNAPITEAVIEIRTQLPESVSVATLETLNENFGSQYPKKKAVHSIEGMMTFGKTMTSAMGSTPDGFLWISTDDRYVARTRMGGFALSRLAPYECWDSFRDEARRTWNIFKAGVNPLGVTRVGVRYVNLINLPLPFEDFGEYLRTHPTVSPELPQGLSGFFFQVTIPQHDLDANLCINEGIVDSKENSKASVILDIDLYTTADLPHDDDALWDILETLRLRKNEVFEACITDKTRELFQ